MFPILENLRGFFSSRPPLVVFMICLGSFAIALITFAYVVKSKDIPNPDVKLDWNTFLERFTKLEMCLPKDLSDQTPFTNSSGGKIPITELTAADVYSQIFHEMISKAGASHSIDKRDAPSKDQTTSNSVEKKGSAASKSATLSSPSPSAPSQGFAEVADKYVNLTIAMNMNVYLKSVAGVPIVNGSSQYISLITGEQMMFKGNIKNSELAVTLTFPRNLSASTCKEWLGKTCMTHLVTACINFQGPAYLFPRTQSPAPSEICSARQPAMDDSLSLRMLSTQVAGKRYSWCHKGARLRPSFSFDDSLTVLLSLEDRSIINLHLMRTSYFLFVMVVTFFCYAMIKGRPTKSKVTHIPYVEKVPTHP